MDNKALSDAKYWSIKIAEVQKEIATLTTSSSKLVPSLNYEQRYRLRTLTVDLAVFSDLLASTIDLMTIEHQKRPTALQRLFTRK